jgi:hypothetical protein
MNYERNPAAKAIKLLIPPIYENTSDIVIKFMLYMEEISVNEITNMISSDKSSKSLSEPS